MGSPIPTACGRSSACRPRVLSAATTTASSWSRVSDSLLQAKVTRRSMGGRFRVRATNARRRPHLPIELEPKSRRRVRYWDAPPNHSLRSFHPRPVFASGGRKSCLASGQRPVPPRRRRRRNSRRGGLPLRQGNLRTSFARAIEIALQGPGGRFLVPDSHDGRALRLAAAGVQPAGRETFQLVPAEAGRFASVCMDLAYR